MSRERWAAALVVALLATACGGEVDEPEPILRPVRFEKVAARAQSVDRSLAAVVRAGLESRLSFRVSGSVQRLSVKVGDRVRRSATLARLDPTDFELRVEEAKAALAQAQASLRRAEADFDRVRALYENNNASKAELDASRAGAESAVALMQAVTKQLEQAKQQLGYTNLQAPSDGAIASVAVEVNENVQAGQEICLLIADRRPEVVIPVPEVMIGSIEAGQPVLVSISALPGQSFSAEVTEVGVAVTGAATTYPVRARFVDWSDSIRAGMAAEVRFTLTGEGGAGRIFVPAVAVGEDRAGRYVFVLEPAGDGTGSVERRSVEIGSSTVVGIEVIDGLAEDELLVTAGARRLSDGMRVRVLGPSESRG